MYSLTRTVPWRKLLRSSAPSFVSALLTAEVFYKFHSFLLECVAFLITWYLFDLAFHVVRSRLKRRPEFRSLVSGGEVNADQ